MSENTHYLERDATAPGQESSDDGHGKWTWKMDCDFIQYNFSFSVIKILMFEINATFKIGFKSFRPREF